MSFQITSASKNIIALNETCKYFDGVKEIIFDVNYFNKMFDCDDCVITEIQDNT